MKEKNIFMWNQLPNSGVVFAVLILQMFNTRIIIPRTIHEIPFSVI